MATEREPDDAAEQAQAICSFINMSATLDADTVLHAISPKLLSHFSLFDILLEKTKLFPNIGTLTSIMFEVNELLQNINDLIVGCLEHDCMTDEQSGVFRVENGVRLSLKMDSFTLKENVEFCHPFLNINSLLGHDESSSCGELDKNERSPYSSQKEKHLCLKCGSAVAKSYGKIHEKKCQGIKVRNPEYEKREGEFFCTVDECNVQKSFGSLYGVRKHFHDCHVKEEEKFFCL